MPQKARVIELDGQRHEFPADATDDEIRQALTTHTQSGKQMFGNQQQPATPQQGPGLGETTAHFGKSVYQGAKGAVTGAYDLGKDLLTNPNWLIEQPAGQRPSTLQKFVGQPADETWAKAGSAYKQAQTDPSTVQKVLDYTRAGGYGLASGIPFAGPWAASLGEQAGSGDITGAAGQAVGGYLGAKTMGKVAKETTALPQHMVDFVRRANSLNEVTKAGAGVYQAQVQPAFTRLQESVKAEGAKTIQQAIEADKAATQGLPVKGTISTATATAEAAKALDQTGHIPTKQTNSILARLTNDPLISLEDAKNLRSDFGNAASAAKRAGNMKLNKILTAAYDELGEGMKGRIEELSGSTKPFEHYNNEFRAYYEMRDGIAGQMQDSLADRHDSIPKLKQFADADLTEIKEQARKYGLDPDEFDMAQKNAKSVTGAHDSLTGKYNKSLYRMVMSGGSGATVALPLSVYAVAHGAGMYGLTPLLLAAYIGAKAKGLEPEIETGRILRKLNVNPDSFQVRTPVEGPMDFDYPNQDEVYSAPKMNIDPSGGATPESFQGKAQSIQRIQETSPRTSNPDLNVRSSSQSSDTLHINFDAPNLKSLGTSDEIAAKLFPDFADRISRASVGKREILGKEAGKYHLQVSFQSAADLKAAAEQIKGIRAQQP